MPPTPAETDPPRILARFGRSVFPGWQGQGGKPDRTRGLFNSLPLHFRPRRVDARTLRLSLSWGLGGSALVLVALLFLSGLLLKFGYQPAPDRAYESILYIQNDVLFGRLMRNLHHWSANGLILVAFLHFLRTVFTGAFHPPRQFNWIIGLALFFLVLLSNFTGYLLPWDQLAYWAVTICAGVLDYVPLAGAWIRKALFGGSELGPHTLSTFFALHTALVPGLLLLLMPFHFWRIRRAGGLVVPRGPEEPAATRGQSVPAIPGLIVRELAAAAVVAALVFMLAAVWDAPLGAKANPGLSPNPTKAPWYFAGLQELLLHFHPFFAVVVIPALLLGGLLLMPYLDYGNRPAGVWFVSRRGRRTALAAALCALLAAPAAIVMGEYLVDWAAWLPNLPPLVSSGAVPTILWLAGLGAFLRIVRHKGGADRAEAVQAMFVFLLVVFILLTVTGAGLRGQGMALTWPWQPGPP